MSITIDTMHPADWDAVRARFGVTLVPEPVLVGFTPEEASILD